MNEMMTRRMFGFSLLGLSACVGVPVRKSEDAPDLTIGLLSDIHISIRPGRSREEATRLFRKALGYFRDRHVDGVLVSGDLANAGLECELEAVADAWFSVFPDGKLPDGSPVANLMHYGDHDAEARFYTASLKESFVKAGLPVPKSLSQDENRRTCWERCFREPWSPVRHVRVKGYDFVLSNFMREKGRSAPVDLADRLAALKLDPSRPFFYSQHRWMQGTYLTDEEMWGDDNGVAFGVLSRYPNAVAFTGHTHYMVTDDRSLNVGAFVNVNTGALLNQEPGRKHENGVDISWYKTDYMRDSQMRCLDCSRAHAGMVMTVRGDRITLERRDMSTGLSLGPDLEFSADPKRRASEIDAVRSLRSVAPEFPAGATASVRRLSGKDRAKRPTEQVEVTFPTAGSSFGRPRAHDYVVRAEKPDGTRLCEKRVYSPGVTGPEALDGRTAACVFAVRELAGAGEVVFTVRPANCWGKCGRALTVRLGG